MAEITINGVKYTNVPNKKAGTKFAASLTQSNIGASQAVQDYVNSAYFYPLVNAIDINWNGVEVEENSYINTTSDLISYIASKESNIDLSSYATMAYVDQKITDLIGGAPETLDTLKELADALEDEASLAYVTQALDGKADKSSLTNYATNSYVTTELDKKADKSQLPDMTNYSTVSYVTTELDKKANKNEIPSMPDLTPYVSYEQANSYYAYKSDIPDMTQYATMSSYNALYEEVQHLAYLISYYHPIKLNIPATPKEGYTFDSTRGGQTSTKTLIDINEDDNTKDYWDNNLWSATSSNNDFSVSFLELASKTQNVGTNVKFNITLPQATNNDQSTNITVNFAGSNDYNAETWTIPITLTASGGKYTPIPTGWTYEGNMMPELLFVIGDSTSTPTTYAFSATPSDGWEFATTMEPPINGVSIDSTTYNITVTPSLLDTTGEWNMHVERQEDSQYWRGEVNTPFIVLAAGTDPTFNFHTSEMWISNEEATTTKELYDSIGEIDMYTPTVTSSNTSIVTATVDPNDNTNIIITFVDEGDATVTATITNPTTGVTRTATMTVHATVNREWIDAHLVNASNDDPADYYYGLPKNSGTMTLNFIANRAYGREPLIGFNTTVVGDTNNAITITHAETTNNDSIAFSVRVDTSKLANMNDWDEIEIQIERAQDSTTSGYSDSRYLRVIPQGADPGMYWFENSFEFAVGTYYNNGMDVVYNKLVSNIGGTPTVTIADTNIAHMDGNSIYGDSVGTTIITATVTDGNNNTRTATIPVNVIAIAIYSNTSVYYNNDPNQGQGFLDTNPCVIGLSNTGVPVDISFEGPEYNTNNASNDFSIVYDTNFSTPKAMDVAINNLTNTYSSGVNHIKFDLSPDNVTMSMAGEQNRFILTFTHNGTTYLTDYIKYEFSGADS